MAQPLRVCERKPYCQKEKLASNPQILRKRQFPELTTTADNSQFKSSLRPFGGGASKYLDSYPGWFQQVELSGKPSPRTCLTAALTAPKIRFANSAFSFYSSNTG